MELIMVYRKRWGEHAPIHIHGAEVEWVEDFKFLCVQIPEDLMVHTHIRTVMKIVRQRLFPLRRLKKFGMGPQIVKFYSYIIESILAGYIATWYGNSSALDCMVLQRVVWTAHYIQDLYISRCERKAWENR
jgi:hypothetical protein